MGKIYNYYDDWKSAILECPKCGWKGTFEEGLVGYYSQLLDCSCPACKVSPTPILAIVNYPTLEESMLNWSKVSDDEKKWVLLRKKFVDECEATHLKSPEQLPELRGRELVVKWDFLERGDTPYTVLRRGRREIWRERAVWEGYKRFREVAEILKQKYGSRLVDLVPSRRSQVFLGGDSMFAWDHIDETRKTFKSQNLGN